MMIQNRKPPAYQEYASELLANKDFRLMGLAERGLLYTLKLECWANKTLPSEIGDLAKYLGFSLSELSEVFNNHVKAFITIDEGELSVPELDDYRNYLSDRREKQSEGGKKGSRKTNQILSNKSTNSTSTSSTNSSSTSKLTRHGTNESLIKHSKVQINQDQSLKSVDLNSDYTNWINDYDKASNGD